MGLIITIIAVFALDRLTKYLAVAYLADINSFPLWRDVFHLTYAENRGAAFSWLSDNPTLLTALSTCVFILLILFLIYQRKRNPNKTFYLESIAMVIGGAAGNLFDRFYHGYVVDFFDFRLINFAIFNVADCFICIGAIILCCHILFDKQVKI